MALFIQQLINGLTLGSIIKYQLDKRFVFAGGGTEAGAEAA